MGFFFRCTYCNTETHVDGMIDNPALNCSECGEDLCEECVDWFGDVARAIPVCEKCLERLEDDLDNEDES